MYDDTPLELDELIDQCRALVYAAVRIEREGVREVLLFVLQERIECLHNTCQKQIEEELAEANATNG
ncbi:hypothetical protein [Brenneria tiliae]|uniref:hypothetical protein n=1 Tax=Brenneria tiliae TaxID=2914984 RepID=UPI002014B522|nr:hypothetical protein [Brenneria tiliae]MCL2897196.1 hypothetical protein [Brenneria tiliae]MCL2904849.1 hypothetical protein [Brenneria tiliae]